MVKIKKFSNGFGLVSGYLGFESIELQKQRIVDFANRLDQGIESFLDLNQYNNKDIRALTQAIVDAGVSTAICSQLAALPFSISTLEDLLHFIAELNQAGVAFISVDERIDTDEGAEVFIRNLLAGWINFKKTRKVANARASSAKARMRNHRIGRKKIRNDVLIQQLRKQGFSIREIAFRTGVSTAAVQKSLKLAFADAKKPIQGGFTV